jgi:hypothetical protein
METFLMRASMTLFGMVVGCVAIGTATYVARRIAMATPGPSGYKRGGSHTPECACPQCGGLGGRHEPACKCTQCGERGGRHKTRCHCGSCGFSAGDHHPECLCPVCGAEG